MLQSSMEELGIVEKAAVEEEVVKKPLTTYDELDSDDLYVRYLHLNPAPALAQLLYSQNKKNTPPSSKLAVTMGKDT